REGQAIFELPDPNHMRVKAKVNESKLTYIHQGQSAQIEIDAFPDRPLKGTVAEVTAIPASVDGRGASDIRVYYAIVNLDSGGFNELRPGLSAEISFYVDAKRDVPRIPLQAICWVHGQPYAALMTPEGPLWQSIELGQMNDSHAELLSGLSPGDRVVANPDLLTPPQAPVRSSATALSGAPKPQG
ncbi:MAG TPA: HlyD family efflux transporter periplasmic adaptor subunit, partial [Isosphaeraceae bacterium]|nr:HlyD family efflux transporter periplasmic adaptor subunit [Isosphaeraceae bacterium]